METNNQLAESIITKIEQDGPISFRDYMDSCLYDHQFGYYFTAGNKIGVNGDFYTSCYLTPSFGAMVGKQLEEMWRLLGCKELTVVEYGAGTGMLCKDILAYLKNIPLLYKHLRYCIVEISPTMRTIAQGQLNDKVAWYNAIDAIKGEIDCVISNELLDNFPVHSVVKEHELLEVYVDYQGAFTKVLRPAPPKLKNYFKELLIDLPKGYQTEVNLVALQWINEISLKLKKGFLLTIDYGEQSRELYSNYRRSGSVRCYNKHRVNDDVFANIGEQDITAHVNFSALIHWGKKRGLDTCGITTQAKFLLALGFKEHLRRLYENQTRDVIQMAREEAYICRSLLMEMGEKYKVLIQSKNMDHVFLNGLTLQQKTNNSTP
ncbi:class I SAM-dependent methyltransferase [Olivibacter domesticus]|uniref:SAM-dependent methyltransferase, MidA family n=1 Tax=Olivibacter domesticus TaxID=407022 RepID=A0A1H7JJ23_OLID1|nr:SAM-dependent methyltransferase [Olivibacter domesticus]SEK73465.1 SAM-dependent methyltransferase, MidA family [Olivibacter domesticus]